MKKIWLTLLLIIAPTAAVAASDPLGVGIVFGEPTGLTAKYWTKSDQAIDGGLAYSFNDFVLFYGDYLWHFPEWLSKTEVAGKGLMPYLGVGGVLWISTESGRHDDKLFTSNGTVGVGLRVPVGIEWRFKKPPVGVFAELVPGMGVIPSVFAFLQGGIGARLYF